MNINSLSTLIFSTAPCFVISILVFFKNPRAKKHILFSLMSLSLGTFMLGDTIAFSSHNKETALMWSRFSTGQVLFTFVFFAHFLFLFLNKETSKKTPLTLMYAGGILSIILSFSNQFFPDGRAVMGFDFYPLAGQFYYIFTAMVFIMTPYIFYELIIAFNREKGSAKQILKYFIIAFSIGSVSAGSALPLVFGIEFPPFGFLMGIFIIIVFFASKKHHIIDI